MSKIVTIPTWSNPFVVSINDKEYTYPAGATVEVPDEVAVVIENAAAAKQKPGSTPEPPFNCCASGGASSWNDLTDRPFGDLPTGGDTLTWDGNTEGLVSFDLYEDGTSVFVKVSDATPSLSDFSDGFTEIGSNGIGMEYPANYIIDTAGAGGVAAF